MNKFIVWIAQGCGIGRIPVAPGTFGSVLGVLFFLSLVKYGPILFGIAVLLSILLSVNFCDAAEKFLKEKDPSSVVLDEIVALPVCFLTWIAVFYAQKGAWPTARYFVAGKNLFLTIGVFVLFRVFDIWKPWPVKQSQKLTGGLGVTMDDILAAIYVNVCCAIYYFALHPAI